MIKCVHLGVRYNILKIPPSTTCAKSAVPPKCSQNQFLANISQSVRPRGKIVEAENVPRGIFYRVGHSQVSLSLLIGLQIHSNWVQIEIFAFFHVFGDFGANIR